MLRASDHDAFENPLWQEKNVLTKASDLARWLPPGLADLVIQDVTLGVQNAPMAIRVTPYLLTLIDWDNYQSDPIRKQYIPLGSEICDPHPMLMLDSLGEKEQSPVDGLVHRYSDKALLLATDTCPVYCRFCTRSYSVGIDTGTVIKTKSGKLSDRWVSAIEYIRSNEKIVDVIISGGDSFRLKPNQLLEIGQELLRISHIRRIRFASKGLAVLPMKITHDLAWTDALTTIHDSGRKTGVEVSFHTHFNHPAEITYYTREAAALLFARGIPVRNQAVFLAGVNDSAEVMCELTKLLSDIHIHPYYVYACDLVDGVENLRSPIHQVCTIERETRGITAGYNTPTFVVDTPGGGGKRDVHSFEYYDRESGLSFYRSPRVNPEKLYVYPDPLKSLSEDMRRRWGNAASARALILDLQHHVERNII